jgi:hypothetical protein
MPTERGWSPYTVDAFDATLAEPVAGYGGGFCDVLPKDRFVAIVDATR